MTRPIATRTNHDHFGFYEIGPYKTYSKLDAIEVSAKTGIDLRWNFNNAVFQQFDWKAEPPGDISFWYAERARQIREKYDYIVLFYSGGADSWNMLKAFVDNNIFVDEIAHYIVYDGTSLSLDIDFNQEVKVSSYPTVKKLIETNPTYKNTKHRVLDGGTNLIKKVTTADSEDYFYNEANTMFSVWGTTFSDMRETLPDYRELIEKKKSVCFVWGYEKPKVVQGSDSKYKIQFSECAAGMIAKPRHQFDNSQCEFNEAFYWSPDLPELISKQAHLIKRYIENCDVSIVDNYFLQNDDEPTFDYCIQFKRGNKKYRITNHAVHRLIYPGWDTNTISCGKPISPLLSFKDAWWLKDQAQASWYLNGVARLRQHIKKIHPRWWVEAKVNPNDPKSIRLAIKQCQNLYDLN